MSERSSVVVTSVHSNRRVLADLLAFAKQILTLRRATWLTSPKHACGRVAARLTVNRESAKEAFVGTRKWLLAAGGAAVAAIIGIGAVAAQDGDDTGGLSFLDRVAQKLGVDTPRLEQAITDARNEEIDERVAAGDLTQEQADRLKEKLDAVGSEEGLGFRLGLRGGGEFAFRFAEVGPGFAICAGLDLDSLAEFLGSTPQELREELAADGATLATVAEAHGKSRDELKAFIEGEAKTELDEAVAAGDLTQERADEILANLRERIDAMIDGEFPPFGKPRGFFRGGPGRFGDVPFEDPNGTPEQEQGGELDPASRS